jgi:hypothetical protein
MKRSSPAAIAAVAVVLIAAVTTSTLWPVSSAESVSTTTAASSAAATRTAIDATATAAPAAHVAETAVSLPATPTAKTEQTPHAAVAVVAARRLVRSQSAIRTAYLKRMYLAVVPKQERAKLAGHYLLGYNLPGLSCGTGCSGRFGDQARSSFDAVFFGRPVSYQRNILAHEAAHAYGFLYIRGYATASWSHSGGWQARFHHLDRAFAGTYDAEAWASCVAWKETGFNNRVLQIRSACTSAAARLAMSTIG